MNRTQATKWLKVITYIGIYGGLLMPLVFVPKVIFPFVFSKLLFFQMLIGLTFPAYLVLIWIEPKLRPKWTPLYTAIAAYFIAVALSVAFAVDPSRAWWGNQERMNGLFTLLHFFAWLSMTTSLIRTWEQWRKILIFEIFLSGVMAAVALLQKPFPNLLLFPAGPRVGGLLDNPIYMAAYQIFNLFFILLIWLKGSPRWMKIMLVVIGLLDVGAFVAAESRGALVGLAVGILVFGVVYAICTPNKKAKKIVLGTVAALFLAYGGLYAFRNTDFVKSSPVARLTDLNATTETRFIAWRIAWQGFLERPLTGWGFDDFHILFNLKYNPESLRHGYYETWFDRSHNTVMDSLAMTGIFGFLTFFGIFGALFYSTIRAYKKGWIDLPTMSVFFGLPIAYFVQNLFVFDQPAGFTMSFFLYALVACATMAEFNGVKKGELETTPEQKPVASKSVPWIAFGILEVLGLLLVWRFSVLPAQASVDTIQSNNYFSAGQYAEALRYARLAAAIPTPYLDEQTFLQARNLISLVENGTVDKVPDWKAWHDLVRDLTVQYLKIHPDNTNPLLIYARFLESYSTLVPEDKPLVAQAYEDAIRTSPKRQQIFYSYARFVIAQGDKQKGYDLFKQAEDFDPEVGESHWYVGLSLSYDLGKPEEGAKEIVASVQSPYPYDIKDVREGVALADAFVTVKDAEGLKKFITEHLAALPNGTVPYFIQIARDAEKLGLTDQRNLILGAIAKQDPSVAIRLVPLQNGSATSIDQSLEMTASQAITPPATAPVTTPAATSTAGAPRLKK